MFPKCIILLQLHKMLKNMIKNTILYFEGENKDYVVNILCPVKNTLGMKATEI